MSLGGFCWIVFLAGLPFAPLLERRLDIWHGQSMWSALCIGTLFGLSIFTKEKKSTCGNKPLAAWLIFTWVWTSWTFMRDLVIAKNYNLVLFIPAIHIFLIILFYVSATTFWDRLTMKRILTALAISGGVMVLYGLCQAVNFDPLFRDLATNVTKKPIVGMTGNPSHFGLYLALILPIFWVYRNIASYLIQAGIWCLFAFLINTTSSVSGIICAGGAGFVWWMFKNKKAAILVGILACVALVYLLMKHGHLQISSDQGRLKAWGEFSKLIAKNPLFGIGPGAISFISNSFSGFLTGWRHCHNEFLQITIEQGLAGLSFACWFIYDTVKRIIKIRHDDMTPSLAAIFTAFLMGSMTLYPAHLWMLGSIGLFAICAINVLSETV